MTSDDVARARQELLRSRIDRVREVIRVYDTGGLNEGSALSRIEEAASGDADAVVRIGNTHTPEIQS